MSVEVSNDKLRHYWDVIRTSGSVTRASKATKIPRTTLSHYARLAMDRLGLPHPLAEISVDRSFTAYHPPEKERSLEELLKARRAEGKRSKDHEEGIKLLKVDIHTPGPVGFAVFGDPHIDSPGCDFELLEGHLELVARNPKTIFAGNIGDLRDNWIGRLERLYAETTVSSKETWKLVEWMMKGAGVQWTWLTKGNHDCWSGKNDPLDWIAKSSGVGLTYDAGLRIAFHHPNGAVTRLNARHDFPGNSMYNPLHALKRETLYGFRDHVIVAGHRHIGADAGDVNGDGSAFQMVRVSGYKVSDAFRHEKGMQAKPIHPAALIIVDPDLPDGDRARAWCAPSVEEGVSYLDWKRKRCK